MSEFSWRDADHRRLLDQGAELREAREEAVRAMESANPNRMRRALARLEAANQAYGREQKGNSREEER